MFKIKTSKSKVKTGFSQQQTKRNNTMLLFNLIRKKAPVSRIMLAEMTGLSATTVSLLVEDLLDNNLVCETGIADTNMRGRKPIMLEVNGKGGFFIIVELLSKGFICSLYDLNAEQIDIAKYRLENIKKENITLNQAIRKLIAKNKIEVTDLIGINLTYPGVVDSIGKRFVSSTVLEISDYVLQEDIARLKEEWAGSQFLITNTSVISAYSEYVLNSGIANSTIIEITMDEGIGAGVVLVGEKGECMHSYIMEMGHMVIERDGKLCKCGNRGCFEALCGAATIIKRVNERAGLSLEYDEEFGADVNRQAVNIIKEEIEKGNKKVIAVVEEVADMLETAIINTINMVNAEYVFLSGLIVEMLGERWINRIRENVTRLNVKREFCKCSIQVSKLDYELNRKGAVYMIMDEAFNVSAE